MLREIAQIFLEDYPEQLAEVRQHAADRCPEGLERAAHTLKGSIANFGAETAFEAALRLETMGREGDLTAADEAVEALERELEGLREGLVVLVGDAAA